MGKKEAKSAYKHYVPPVKKVENWYENFNFVLIESMDDLKLAFKDFVPGKSFMSMDTETTGLNPEELELVGFSFCLDGKTAYYVPVYHFEYEHNLGEEAVSYFYDRMVEAKKVFMFNVKFDARVFEFRGYKETDEEFKNSRFLYVKYDMSKVNYFDVAIPVWLADTNIKLPSLKWAALHFLGIDMMHFDEVIEEAGNFFYLNPSENPNTVFYAASDALCTYLLVPAVMKYYKESGIAGQLDNKMLYPLMHYETEKLWLDEEKIRKFSDEADIEIDRLEREVYNAFGYQLNLNSPVQVAQAFERLGIDTGERTASGSMSTGMKVLEALPEEVRAQYPALDSFVKYKSLFKLRSSYLNVLSKQVEEKGFLRCAYKTQQVPTGRLAGGKDTKNTYFSPINIQALPKPHVSMYDVYDLGNRDFFSKKHNILFGYQFVMSQYDSDGNHIIPTDNRYIGWAEGMNPSLNIRSCITPKMYKDSGEDEFIYCAVDYAAQELRIPANLSREPVWVNAFTSGGDVHKSTAISIWGEENYNKDYRKMAKGANFCETASSLVLTDKGYLHPYEITPNETLVTRQGTDTIDNIVKVDNEPCIKIMFDNGIEGTYHENHKLYCWNGKNFEWVRVKDITEQHQVITFRDKCCKLEYQPHIIDLSQYTNNEKNLTKYGISIDANSKEFAYLMGIYLGDGNLDYRACKGYELDSYLMRQCVSKDIKDKVIDYIKRLGFSDESIKIDDNGKVSIISYGGRGFGRYVKESFGGPNNKKIPDFVFYDWDTETIRYLIAGLIDSDGGKCESGWNIFNTNKALINRLAILCNYVGLRTYLTVGESAIYKDGVRITEGVKGKFKNCYTLKVYNDGNDMPLLLDYKKCNNMPKSWQYSWNIDCEARKDIVKCIRESCDYRGNKTLENAIGNIRDGHTGLTEFSIREIEKTGEFCISSMWYPARVMSKESVVEDIYAIQCPNHEYIANSMNSHNSILYGAAAQSFADDPMYNMTLSEAEEFYNKYKKALPTLFLWEERLQRRGRREGYVSTYFGRPRRVKGYFDNRNFAFANRTIVNTVVQGCHVYDNRILTDRGYRKIGEIYEEHQRDIDSFDYHVWNGFKWCRFFPVSMGKDTKYKLHFDNGQIIECDSRHRVRVFTESGTEWKYVKDLKLGEDKVCFSKNRSDLCSKDVIKGVIGHSSKSSRYYPNPIEFDRTDVKVLCYLYGMILGDGHIGYGHSRGDEFSDERAGFCLYYGNSKRANIELIKKFLDKHFIKYRDNWDENHISKSGTVAPVGTLTCDCYPLVDAIQQLTGDLGGNVYTKRLGNKVYNLDRVLVKCVLKGIHDTDGNSADGRVHLANENLVKDIAMLMRYFGYDYQIRSDEDSYTVTPHAYDNSYVRDVSGEDGAYDGSYRKSTLPYHTSILKELSPTRKHLNESDYTVMRRVKDGGSCELKTFRRIMENLNDLDSSIIITEDYDYHVITDVENTGEEVETYTLEVLDDSHQYVCEGMISHNTASDLLKIVLCKMWKNLLNNPKYRDDVAWRVTIHDEIGYTVRASKANEIVKIIEENMRVKLPEWPVTIEVEASCGWSMGGLFAFQLIDDGEGKHHYAPKLD